MTAKIKKLSFTVLSITFFRYTILVKQKVIFGTFLFFLILNIFIWSAIYIQDHQKLKVDFLDVGQGGFYLYTSTKWK